MNSNYALTEVEQRALESARRLLGPNLANYLLSGLGETNTVHCRAFTAMSASSEAEDGAYRFETKDESGRVGLPAGRDPLVLAALIELLLERQPLNSRISFRDAEVLERLQWPATRESREQIRQALGRYFQTAYYLVDPTIEVGERAGGRYASAKRLVIGYETSAVLLPVRRTTDQGLTKVQFLPDLSYDALSGSKRFLGIDFQTLQGVEEVTC